MQQSNSKPAVINAERMRFPFRFDTPGQDTAKRKGWLPFGNQPLAIVSRQALINGCLTVLPKAKPYLIADWNDASLSSAEKFASLANAAKSALLAKAAKSALLAKAAKSALLANAAKACGFWAMAENA